jgi:hypothetical protein
MLANFAKVVNVQSTRKQSDRFFATDQICNVADERRETVELSNRVIPTSLTVGRVCVIRGAPMRESGARYRTLNGNGLFVVSSGLRV